MNFRLKNQGNTWTELHELTGHKVFLFFLSDVQTLDNQVHMINYAKEIAWFQRLGVIVIGICGSSVAEIKEQSDRLYLPFILLSDESGEVRKAYDVWNCKITFGTERWITSRTSLIIDEHGMILKTYKRANIERNVYDVLEYLQHLHDKASWRMLSRRTKERIRREQAQAQGQENEKKEARKFIMTK